jgi:hypothetical protein
LEKPIKVSKEVTIRLIDFYVLDQTTSYSFQPPGGSEKWEKARYSDGIGVDELYAQWEKPLGRPVVLRVGTTALPRAPTPLSSLSIGDGVIGIEFATALEKSSSRCRTVAQRNCSSARAPPRAKSWLSSHTTVPSARPSLSAAAARL